MIQARNMIMFGVIMLSIASPVPKAAESASLQNRRASVVQIKRGDQTGSGVIIKELGKGYVVLTNKHVLNNTGLICVKSTNGIIYQANRLGKDNPNLDVAIVWIPKRTKQEIIVNLGTSMSQRFAMPLSSVIATGYPDGKTYSEREGILVPLLPYALEDGYNLTYTSSIDKGMSGGGIFNDRDILIGINGIHSQPLWSAEIRDHKGRVVPSILARKLETVSVGISMASIMKELNNVIPQSVPASWRWQNLVGQCRM
jgi:S1-C subfamily serine protease